MIHTTRLSRMTASALAAGLGLWAAPLALAQEAASNGGASPATGGGGDGGGATSFFRAFLISGDWLGTLIIWFLLLLSAVSLALIIRFAIQYRRSMLLPPSTRENLDDMLGRKNYRQAIAYANDDPSYLGRLTSSALNEASNGYGAMERAIEEASDTETSRILRPIEYLNTLGNISPMIGLFGTVYGMILAFQTLVEKGGNPNPTDLAAGISTALVTTFWGLVVAIPALAAYATIRNKVDALTTEGLIVAEDLISPFKPGTKKGASSSGTSGGGGTSPSKSASKSDSTKTEDTSGGGSGSSRPRATPKPKSE